jgi:hypothetical protein
MSGKNNSGRNIILALGLFLAFLFFLEGAVFRCLWFDEALSVLEFSIRGKITDIYFNYNIPNNHILFNMFLRLWLTVWEKALPLNGYAFRLLSALTAFASVFSAYFILKKKCGAYPAFLIVFCFVCSLPFCIYSVAVRGYIQSFFAVLVAFYFCMELHSSGKKRFVFLYLAASLLAVGTIPSNIIALSAFSIYFFPLKKLKEIMTLKYLATLLVPPVSLIVFYAPIYRKFYKNFRLNEGWPDNFQAAIAVYSSFVVSFLPLIACAAAGAFIMRKSPGKLKIWLFRSLIFMIPLPFLFFRYPAPFPRVFFPLWAVWIILFAVPIKAFFAILRRKKIPFLYAFLAFASVIFIWGECERTLKERFSSCFIKGQGLDDFYSPYYMKDNFRPDSIAFTIKQQHMKGNSLPVFYTFDADHYSLLFYSRSFGIPSEKLFFDNPKLKSDEYFRCNRPFFLGVRDQKDLQKAIKRFSLKKTDKIISSGTQILYQVE